MQSCCYQDFCESQKYIEKKMKNKRNERVPKGERETVSCVGRLFLNALICILALMLLCHVSMLMRHV